MNETPRYLVLADWPYGLSAAKTAVCLVRYAPEQVVAAIDPADAGKTVRDVLGFGPEIPIIASINEALPLGVNRLLVGAAPAGGTLPDNWRKAMHIALENGMDVYAGLHVFLNDDPDLSAAARANGRTLVDLRAVPDDLNVPTGAREQVSAPVILTVGTDCNVGKMTTTWEIARAADRSGGRVGIAATGQTGRLLAGTGFAIDRVIADFMAGAAERLVVEAAPGADIVVVEGQGSLLHPFYSGVTLGLLHGSAPDAMILCHEAGREGIRLRPELRIPPLSRVREVYEEAARWIRPARVVGVALNTWKMGEDEARRAIEDARAETGLPVEDAVRFPTGALWEACRAVKAPAVAA